MNKTRAALYSALMVGQQHSPDTSNRASALLDAFAAGAEAAALTRAADHLRAARLPVPIDEAEEHVNAVLSGLAADLDRFALGEDKRP